MSCVKRQVGGGMKVSGVIRSLVTVMGLQLEYARVLHETLLVHILMFGSETMIFKERSGIRAVQMDNLRSLLGNRRMENAQNAQMRSDKKIEEGALRWFDPVERMENDRIAKRVYVM